MAYNNDYTSIANWDLKAINFFQKGFLEMQDHVIEGWSSFTSLTRGQLFF